MLKFFFNVVPQDSKPEKFITVRARKKNGSGIREVFLTKWGSPKFDFHSRFLLSLDFWSVPQKHLKICEVFKVEAKKTLPC